MLTFFSLPLFVLHLQLRTALVIWISAYNVMATDLGSMILRKNIIKPHALDYLLFRRSREEDSSHAVRNLERQSTTCSINPPYIWLIYDDGKHVGYGIGTMHVDSNVALNTNSQNVINKVLSSSCGVYTEIPIDDDEYKKKIFQCITPGEVALISDLPSDSSKIMMKNKLSEVFADVYPDDTESAIFFADMYEKGNSLQSNIDLIQQFNTPELWNAEKFRMRMFSTEIVPKDIMDADIYHKGRPKGGLESIETTCSTSNAIQNSAQYSKDFVASNFTEDYVNQALGSNYSEMIDLYKCGDHNEFEEYLAIDTSDPFSVILLDERNEDMAVVMTRILEQSKEKVTFAVGLAHWDIGDKSLITLLEQKGYNLERIDSNFDFQGNMMLVDRDCVGEIYYDVVTDKISHSEKIEPSMSCMISLFLTVFIFITV